VQVGPRGFLDILVRVVVVQIAVAVLAVGGFVVALGSQETSGTQVTSADAPIWKPEYSRVFPGCVATVLWPVDETPAALVVQNEKGSLSRVTVADFRDRSAAGLWTRGTEVVGVCR
jgi:hypothetical protein